MNQKPARALKGPLGVKQMILAYIKEHQLSYGYPPTLGEIGRAVGKSRSVVHYHIGKMTEAGVVERQGHSPRAIKVLE